MAKSFESSPLLLLLGGEGSRVGIPKALIEIGGVLWLELQLKHYASIGGKKVVLVLGHHVTDYQSAFPFLEAEETSCLGLELKRVTNPDPGEGQFSSLHYGLQALQDFESVFVSPIDVPLARLEVWQALFEGLGPEIKVCIPKFESRGGHPVLLGEAFVKTLLDKDLLRSRLDHCIQELPDRELRRVAVKDFRVSLNLNEVEDWESYGKAS